MTGSTNQLAQTGQFADTLRAAIRARGLGLERIRDRLRGHGVSISLATLSYWQSGRSRPERRDSMVALTHLESVLELAPGTLTALLGPPRPRGRWLTKAPDHPDIAAFWSDREKAVGDAVRGVDTRWDERLTRISQHDVVTVGADREERSFTSRQVLRAEADGPDRWVVIMHIDEHNRTLPLVRPLRHCRLGQVVNRPEDGLLVAELLFDRPLARGETIITEHALVNRAPCPLATSYERKFRLPVREFVLEINFDPSALPKSCVQYSRIEGQAEVSQPAVISDAHSTHGVALNFGPGRYGFRWEWDDPA